MKDLLTKYVECVSNARKYIDVLFTSY